MNDNLSSFEERELLSLTPHPQFRGNFRGPYNDDVDMIADSIKSCGLQTVIQILPEDNACGLPANTVLFGHKEVCAVTSLGWSTVSVRIRKDLALATPKEIDTIVVPEMIGCRSPDLLARFRQTHKEFDRQMKEYDTSGITDEVMAEHRREYIRDQLGVTDEIISQLIFVAGTCIEIQEAFTAGQLTLSQAAQLARFAGEDLREVQSELEMCTKNLTSWRSITRKFLSSMSLKSLREPEPDEALAQYLSLLESCCKLIPQFEGQLTRTEVFDSLPAMAAACDPIARVFDEAKTWKCKFDSDVKENAHRLIRELGRRNYESF